VHPERVERCRQLAERIGERADDLKSICRRMLSDDATDVRPGIVERCRQLANGAGDRPRVPDRVCDQIGRLAANHPDFAERCRAALAEGRSPGEIMKEFRAEAQTRLKAEREQREPKEKKEKRERPAPRRSADSEAPAGQSSRFTLPLGLTANQR